MVGRPTVPSRPRPIVLAAIGYALYLPVLAGFFLHTSPPGAWRLFGKYSVAYAVFLLFLLLPAVGMPWLAQRLARPTHIPRRDGGQVVLSGWRKVGLATLAAVVAVLAGGVAAEVGARLVGGSGDAPPDPTAKDCEVFFEMWPPRGRPFNRWGFLGPEVSVEKPRGTYRIMALGGSTTMLAPPLNAEETFLALLETSLAAARPARRIEVLNAAAQSHSTLQSLMKYAALVQDFHPDLVLVMHAVNDLEEGHDLVLQPWKAPFERDYSQDRQPLRRLMGLSALGRPQNSLWADLRVTRGVAAAFEGCFYSDRRVDVGLSDEERLRLAERVIRRALPAFRRNLRTLGELVQGRGARFVIVSQPTMFRPEAPPEPDLAYPTEDHLQSPAWGGRPALYRWAYTSAMRLFNDAAREVAHELGADFVDLERAVPPAWAFFQAEERDGFHMNAAGCALAAKALHEAILPFVLEEPSPVSTQPSADR